MINRLPWRKKLRTSAANNLDKINEVIDYINHSDISPVMLSDSASGRIVDVGMASSMKGLEVFGESVQNGVPSPDAPVPIQVVKGRNLIQVENGSYNTDYVTKVDNNARLRAAEPITIVGGQSYVLSYITNKPIQCVRAWLDSSMTVLETTSWVTSTSFAAPVGASYLVLVFRYSDQSVIDSTDVSIQLEEGSTATPYVPYGYIGLSVTADGETTVTPIPLPSKGFAASLPDGTKDVLTIDSAGRWEWAIVSDSCKFSDLTWTRLNNGVFQGQSLENGTNGVQGAPINFRCDSYRTINTPSSSGTVASYPDAIAIQNNYPYLLVNDQDYSDAATFASAMSNTNVLYPLATPTTESGYIGIPEIPDGATVTIEATIPPEFTLDWWSYQDITDMIADLKEYTDWKVSQVEGASTLGNNRLGSFPAVKEIAGEGKIKDEEAPAEIEDEKVPEEIEDTEDE